MLSAAAAESRSNRRPQVLSRSLFHWPRPSSIQLLRLWHSPQRRRRGRDGVVRLRDVDPPPSDVKDTCERHFFVSFVTRQRRRVTRLCGTCRSRRIDKRDPHK
jgi:hypothetical protein